MFRQFSISSLYGSAQAQFDSSLQSSAQNYTQICNGVLVNL